jgi:two-component system sensor histidine kinase YesM
MRPGKLTSITGRIRRSVWSVAALLTVPVVVALVFMLVYAQRYQVIIQRMDMAAELKPVVETDLARDLFSVAAGRVSFAESGVTEKIELVNATLERMMTDSGSVQLTLARRTMDTLQHYAGQVRDGMAEHRPVSEIEAIVDEVWQVGALVGDKIDAYIVDEISAAAEANTHMRRWLLAALAAEGLLLLFAFLWTRNETRQLTASIREALHSLEQAVSRIAEGRFRERVDAMEVAELQNLADQINLLAARLEGLIAQIQQKQEHLAKAELRTLQAQINPHFLYNTLDTIVWQAESGKAEDVIRLTRSLSDFFRISLSAGADWIPVEQELRHTAAYLSIQKIRYRDILDYQLETEGDLTEVWMPKLLVQPLVENALYHGIKARRGGGRILIRVCREGEQLTFSVSDSGRGIEPEKLESLRAMLREEPAVAAAVPENEGSGFGLRNVNLRIRLYYRQETGLVLRSDGEGTEVSFSVPVRRKEELEHDESLSRG